MPRFIHAADIHLDSPLTGLRTYEGAPVDEIRSATRRAFVKMIDLAIHERIDFLLIAGDLYDGDWKDYNTGLFMTAQLSRLNDAGIPVVTITGNHDAENRMTRSLRLPGNVTQLSTEQPETKVLEDFGVAIHGQGFAVPKTTSNLAATYPDANPQLINIGLLHTCVSGREGHASYAPCSIEDMKLKSYDYWALGHIHQREILEDAGTHIAFPGNLQGRHIRETGPKGCSLVELRSGEPANVEFVPLDVFRWERADVDLTGIQVTEDALELWSDKLDDVIEQTAGMPFAIRLHLTGETDLSDQLYSDRGLENELRNVVNTKSGQHVWLERVKLQTSLPNGDQTALETDGPLEELFQLVSDIEADPVQIEEMMELLNPLSRRVPSGIADDLFSQERMAELLKDVRRSLAGRLQTSDTETRSDA